MRGLAALGVVVVLVAGCAHGPAPLPATVTTLPPVTLVPASGSNLLAIARTAVTVRNVDCLATGTAFTTTTGATFTVRHVAADSTAVQISTWDGSDLNATRLFSSASDDLAQLVLTLSGSKLALATANAATGSPVWVAGYPQGDQLQLTPGTVVDYVDGTQYQESGQIMRSTAPIQPGNSGSPVLNAEGAVVGIAFALERSTGDALIIPVSTLSEFVAGQLPMANPAPACEDS